MANLARFLMETGNAHKALPMFQECEALYRKVLGPHHPYSAMTTLGHGICLSKLERFDDAIAKLADAYLLLSKMGPPLQSATRRAAQELAIAFDKLGKPDDAATWRQTADLLKPPSP